MKLGVELIVSAPLSWDPEPKEHTMETMTSEPATDLDRNLRTVLNYAIDAVTRAEADAIGAAMLLLTEALDAIA